MKKLIRKIICISIMAAMMMTMSGVPANAAIGFSSAVTGVKAVSNDYQSVKVTCKKKLGASEYWFYCATSKGGKYKLAAKAEKNKAVIGELKTGKAYFFKVRAVKGKNNKTRSRMSTPVKCIPKLGKPAGLNVNVGGIFSGHVTWNKVAGAKKYNVYRSVYKTKKYSCIGTVEVTDDSDPFFDDNKIREKKVYYYKVKAFRGKKTSTFSAVRKLSTPLNGNAAKYDLDTTAKIENSPLKDKGIFFLGSSITYGSASDGVSFVDYVGYQTGANCYKEAVSATTMAVSDKKPGESYVQRLSNVKQEDLGFVPDIFVSQLSLNDGLAKNNVPLGVISDTCRESTADFNVDEIDTVAEAIEYITVYAHEKWPGCQVAFFTIKNCDIEKYDQMVNMLYLAQQKWTDEDGAPFTILDVWNDSSFMNVKGDKLNLYMRDRYHPTKAGYKMCWLPVMRDFLTGLIPEEPEQPEDPGELTVPDVQNDNPEAEPKQPADEQEQQDADEPEAIIETEPDTDEEQ